MKKLKIAIVFLLLVFCAQTFAADEESETASYFRYIPYAAAILIYILSSKLKPKNADEKKPFSGLLRKPRHEIGPNDTVIVYEGYERNYETIEPK